MAVSEMAILGLLFAGIGGTAGAFIRFAAVEVFKKQTTFPVGVLISNAVGTFVLALVTFYISKEAGSLEGEIFRHMELFVFFFNTGVLGSLTTFSALSYDNLIYLEQKKFLAAAANIFLNIAAGTVAVFAGFLAAFYIL